MAHLQTRREFLTTCGKTFAGVAMTDAAMPLLDISAQSVFVPKPAPHPYPYVKLDPQATMERGCRSIYVYSGCGMGAFDAIIGRLADMIGYPYDQIHIQILASASGGCGAGTM